MSQPKQNDNADNSNKTTKSDKTDEHNHSEEKKEDTHHDHHDHDHSHDHSHGHSHDHSHSHEHSHGHSHGHNHHGHDHGSGGCKHDHEKVNEMNYGSSLYMFIDKKNCKCLNESEKDSGKKVFKAYDDRLDTEIYVESDIDGELLFTVYFTAEVQLRSIQLTMNDEDSAPSKLMLWNDPADKIDFDNHEDHKCSQEIELAFDNECRLHWKTAQHKFNDLTVLKMLFQREDYDEDDDDTEVRICYIGLKGNYKGPKSRRAVHTIYEAASNPNDHELSAKANQMNNSSIGK